MSVERTTSLGLGVFAAFLASTDAADRRCSSFWELSFATNIRPEKILEVLKIIQTFTPTGVGARDLRECLLLQLDRDGKQDTLEHRIIRECMEALGKRRIPEIARTLDTTIEGVRLAIARIANLEPRPGRAFLSNNNLE